MKLSEETKNAIQAEYDSWKDLLWAGKDLKERQKLGQLATPPALVFKMLEKIDSNDFFKDSLPVVVAQVQMLGEGINVSSFNSILTLKECP